LGAGDQLISSDCALAQQSTVAPPQALGPASPAPDAINRSLIRAARLLGAALDRTVAVAADASSPERSCGNGCRFRRASEAPHRRWWQSTARQALFRSRAFPVRVDGA